MDRSSERDRQVVEQRKSQQRGDRYQTGSESSSQTDSNTSQPSDSGGSGSGRSSGSSKDQNSNRDREIIGQYKDNVRDAKHQRQTQQRERSSPEVINRNDDLSTDNSLVQHQINNYKRGIDQEYGDLLDNDDYQYVVRESGQVGVRLTDSGRDKLQDSYELSAVEKQVRKGVDDVKRVEINETFEDGYTATVYTTDGRQLERQFSFSQEASEKFAERARERQPTNHTGSFIDTNQEGEGVVRGVQRPNAELVKNSQGDISTREREKARERIADEAGVDVGQIDNVRRNEEGRWVATVDREKPKRPDEQFGDFAINLGDDKRVEDYLRAGAATYDEFANGVVDLNSKYNPYVVLVREAYEAVEPHAPEWVNTNVVSPETGRTHGEEFSRGLVRGALQIGNLPAVALGLKEGAEFVGHASIEVAEGNGGDLGSDVWEVGGKAVDEGVKAVKKNPGNIIGIGAGSLVASAGTMGAAARYSGKAGLATRLAIQPGEEVFVGSVNYGLSKFKTGQRILNKIPGGRLDNEELAIAVYQRNVKPAASRLSRRIQRTKSNFVNQYARQEASQINKFLNNERAQAQLTLSKTRDTEVSEVESRRQKKDRRPHREQHRADDLDTPKTDFREVHEGPVERSPREELATPATDLREAGIEVELSPREMGLAEQLDTPRVDFREVHEIESVDLSPRVRQLADQVDSLRSTFRDPSEIKRVRAAAEDAELRRRAVATRLDMEVESLSHRDTIRAEVLTGEETARQRQQQQSTKLDHRERLDTKSVAESIQDTRQQTDFVLDQQYEVSIESEITSEATFDSEIEVEQTTTELETETVQEITQEIEREAERELERELERERERDRENPFENQESESAFGVDMSAWETSWETGIADIDDLWKETFGRR
ncbi:hypothetical protein ACH9L7_20295 (plasmid) [Haloferax sp. S1W]|uniref:hypothetical protein n=1 Tax=Haloferax sp. S1W TaxID=3377110 RepID=UPI0037C6CB0B